MLMPAALIIIMALVQDAPFQEYQDLRFSIVVADEDGGALGAEIKNGLRQSRSFMLADSIGGAPATGNSLRAAIQSGRCQIGLVIPKGATAEIANAANTIANTVAVQTGGGQLPQRPPRDSVAIRLYFDPVSRPAFRLAIRAALEKYMSTASTRLLLSRLTRMAGSGRETTAPPGLQPLLAGLRIQEAAVTGDQKAPLHINSVQHNVPAWAIFGMFFIVIPLSGHIIREREEGSALRVRLIPGAERGVGAGRILANTIVCCLQFGIMCGVGRWLLPLFRLPALTLGAHPAALLPVVMATALCATAYGYLIGSAFRSGAQALPFGAISIVMLSALGGIWVPVEILSPVLQAIAKASPLHWALQGVQAVILRDGSWADVAVPVAVLSGLAALMWIAGLRLGRRLQTGV